jgi:hypothetical protein
MKRFLILIVACIASSPAIAAGIAMHEERNNPVQWQVIGSVPLPDVPRAPQIFNGFEGRKPEEIGLFAPKETVFCKDIVITYPNSTLNIEGRTIRDGMVAYVKLPADAGAPSTMMLPCHAAHPSNLHIVVRRDRSETQGWHRLSNDKSKGRGSVAVSLPHKITSIGLMPIDTDASCKSAELFLQDGQTRMLEIPPLKANRITAVDLPSGGAKLRKISFKCDSTDPTIIVLHLDSFVRFATD